MATHDVLGDIKLSKKQYFYVIEVKGTLKVHEWVYYRPFYALFKKKKKSMLDPIGTDQSFIEMATGHLLTLNFFYVKPQYKL